MKKLIHSKTFRKKLLNWTFIYLSVLILFTCVVTYSRYISSMTVDDSARTAKFKVKVDEGKICSTVSPNMCNLDKYKPYDILEYNFGIDTRDVEVATLLSINIEIDKNFDIVSLYDVTNGEEIVFPTDGSGIKNRRLNDDITTLNFSYDLVHGQGTNNRKISLVSNVGTGTTTTQNNRKYKLKLKLSSTDYAENHSIEDSIKINYSATQKD